MNMLSMKWAVHRLFRFFHGEYFADALRNTLIIAAPILLFFKSGNQQAALGIGVGALLISLTDLPGNRLQKFRTAILSIGIFFCTSMIVTNVLFNPVFTGLTFFVLTLLFSMLSVFSVRAGLTGTMAIILSTFLMGLAPAEPLRFSLYILTGSCWFYLFTLIQISIWPYRSLNNAVSECIRSTAELLRAKAKCYDENEPLEEAYQLTISLHIQVTARQEQLRSLLLSDPQILKAGTKGRHLLAKTISLIELYEQVTAIHYDYQQIREKLAPNGSLTQISDLIGLLADELDGLKINKSRFMLLNDRLVILSASADTDSLVFLKKITKNISDIASRINNIHSSVTFNASDGIPGQEEKEYQAFLPARAVTWSALWKQVSLKSPVFRFALRLSLLFLTAYLFTLWIGPKKYSYWMLLTIVIVARPKFGITWKRNMERLWGTLAGLVIGFMLTFVWSSSTVLLILSAVFLLGFFAFNRTNYMLSVACITPAVVLSLSLYQGHTAYIVSERLYYTLSGCILAFAGVYLFPVWERSQLKKLVSAAIAANERYLSVVLNSRMHRLAGSEVKLARKNAHTAMALLSESLQYMLLEPAKSQTDLRSGYTLQSLIFRINSLITSVLLAEAGEDVSAQTNLLHRLEEELDTQVKILGYPNISF